MNGKRQHRLRTVLRGGAAFIALAISGAPSPLQPRPMPPMIIRSRTGRVSRRAEQILAAAKDFAPIYYQRYIIDKHNEPPEVQQARHRQCALFRFVESYCHDDHNTAAHHRSHTENARPVSRTEDENVDSSDAICRSSSWIKETIHGR
jgi:hypothetical protein